MLKHITLLIYCTAIVTAQEEVKTTNEDPPENNIFATLDPLDPLSEDIENIPKDFLFSWQARRSIRKLLAQMPCGWPEYNIPPLAPYTNDNFMLSFYNNYVSSETNFHPLSIYGLDNMEINRLSIGIIFRRVNFDFNFPNITFSGIFNTSTVLNLKKLLDIELAVNGTGNLNLTLKNLRISGSFKYKLPVFLGSAKIFQLKTEISLDNVFANLSGIVNNMLIEDELNDLIARYLFLIFNDNDLFWNTLLQRRLLPAINAQLEGQTLWKLLLWAINGNKSTCSVANINTMDMEELHQLLLKSH